ncbi:MAG: DUF2079 domain-containing protein [bacterium]|nr:DUF2079 domain-containing protein [bacterium]
MLYVKKLVVDHNLMLIGPSSGGLQGFYHGVLWYYILAIPFIIGNGNPAALTLFMAVCSTASILLTYFILKKIANNGAALIGTVIYSFAGFSIATSRFIWNPYPIVWIMPLYFYALHSAVNKKQYALPLAAFLTSLMIHFEVVYGLTLIPTLILLTCKYLKQWKILAFSLFLFLIPVSPYILFDLRHNFQISTVILQTISTGGANLSHAAADKATAPFERVLLRLDDLYSYTAMSLSPSLYLNGTIMIILVFIVLKLRKRSDQKEEFKFILLVVATVVIPFFLFLTLKYAVWGYYWIGNPALFTLLAAFIVGKIPAVIPNKSNIILGLIILVMLVTYNPLQYFPTWKNGTIGQGTQTLSTQRAVVATILRETQKDPYSVYVLTPPVYDYVYRYLFQWQASQTLQNYPLDHKQQTIYLVLEPSASDPQAEYFKKKVIRTEEIAVKKWNFAGSLQLEKIITGKNESNVDSNVLPVL